MTNIHDASEVNSPHDDQTADRQRAVFYRLMTESGVPHVHGMEILRLVKMCAGAYDRILGEKMRDQRISHPQWRLLIHLYLAEYNGEESLSPTDLAHSLRLSKNTISTHLRTLEESQLIERRLDPDDLRAFRIQLTDRAREMIRTSTPQQMQFLNQLTSSLSGEECEILQGLLTRLYGSIAGSAHRE